MSDIIWRTQTPWGQRQFLLRYPHPAHALRPQAEWREPGSGIELPFSPLGLVSSFYPTTNYYHCRFCKVVPAHWEEPERWGRMVLFHPHYHIQNSIGSRITAKMWPVSWLHTGKLPYWWQNSRSDFCWYKLFPECCQTNIQSHPRRLVFLYIISALIYVRIIARLCQDYYIFRLRMKCLLPSDSYGVYYELNWETAWWR